MNYIVFVHSKEKFARHVIDMANMSVFITETYSVRDRKHLYPDIRVTIASMLIGIPKPSYSKVCAIEQCFDYNNKLMPISLKAACISNIVLWIMLLQTHNIYSMYFIGHLRSRTCKYGKCVVEFHSTESKIIWQAKSRSPAKDCYRCLPCDCYVTVSRCPISLKKMCKKLKKEK